MRPYLTIAVTPMGEPIKKEFVEKNEHIARDSMRRYMVSVHRGYVGDIQVFEKLDPVEESKKDSNRATAFEEFYRDDVLTLPRHFH